MFELGLYSTKALLKSAQVFNYLQNAEEFGINKVDKPSFDFENIVRRSRDVAGTMSKGVQFLMKKNKIEIINGEAKVLPDENHGQS